MRAFGYEKGTPDIDDVDPRALELREATLAVSFDDIRRIHRFVTEVVAIIDSVDFDPRPGWHWHFRDHDSSWTPGEADFILAWRETDALADAQAIVDEHDDTPR